MGNRTSSNTAGQQQQEQPRLYRNSEWDDSIVRRLVKKGQLAPHLRGFEEDKPNTEECPICFLNYPSLNQAVCCRKRLCTECFLQLNSPSRLCPCPFCNAQRLTTVFLGPLTKEERLAAEAEEKRVQELLQAKAQQDEWEKAQNPQPPPTFPAIPAPATTATANTVGEPEPDTAYYEEHWQPPRQRSRVPHMDSQQAGSALQARRSTESTTHHHGNTQQTRYLGWEDIFGTANISFESDAELEQCLIQIAIQNSMADLATTSARHISHHSVGDGDGSSGSNHANISSDPRQLSEANLSLTASDSPTGVLETESMQPT